MFKIWVVTQRMPAKIKPKKAELINFASKAVIHCLKNNLAGIYVKAEKGFWFFSAQTSKMGVNTVGFLPKEMPYADRYQPIPKGDTGWFEDWLKENGFKKVENI